MKYKGQIAGFPDEIVEKMLERQVEQGNDKDVSVFEKDKEADLDGFIWSRTSEKHEFWENVINYKDFDVFFEKYPKIAPNKSISNETNFDLSDVKLTDSFTHRDSAGNALMTEAEWKEKFCKTYEPIPERLMYVWDDWADRGAFMAVVFGRKNEGYLAWYESKSIDDAKEDNEVSFWVHAEDISKFQINKKQLASQSAVFLSELNIKPDTFFLCKIDSDKIQAVRLLEYSKSKTYAKIATESGNRWKPTNKILFLEKI